MDSRSTVGRHPPPRGRRVGSGLHRAVGPGNRRFLRRGRSGRLLGHRLELHRLVRRPRCPRRPRATRAVGGRSSGPVVSGPITSRGAGSGAAGRRFLLEQMVRRAEGTVVVGDRRGQGSELEDLFTFPDRSLLLRRRPGSGSVLGYGGPSPSPRSPRAPPQQRSRASDRPAGPVAPGRATPDAAVP